ncbi:MAG: carboxypeptidase-like regulatory domain-containing protein [Candidatus Poribacteria bacterium]|nr:carboxypeptidase-like regulatory domain-containing protein [Candidatus Poribacteria bacterium]
MSNRIVAIPFAIIIFVWLGCGETIEIERASFSGRVVDESGNPVAGLELGIIPCDVVNHDASTAVYIAVSNDTGHFTIRRIYPGQAHLMLLHEDHRGLFLEPKYQLLSFKVEGLTSYRKDLSADPCTQETFFIPPGARIENVEVIVQLRMPKNEVANKVGFSIRGFSANRKKTHNS